MELVDSIEKRTSIRDYLNESVNPEDIKEMVRRAGLAPSINNQQPWRFIAITNKEVLKNMARSISDKIMSIPANESSRSLLVKSQVEWFSTFFKNAPAVIVMAMHPYEDFLEKGARISHDELNRIRNYPDMQMAGACIQNILLTATEMGYGACWMSSPLTAKEELEKILGIEEPWHLTSMVSLGRPAVEKAPTNKKPFGEIFEVID